MINLQKEREAFEDQWKKNGYFHFNLERKNGEERYSHRHVNFSFKFWCQRAELAQEETNKVESMNHHLAEINSDLDRSISIMKTEITELKQKLEKLESGEFVLVPREPTKEVIIGLASGYFSEDGSPWLDPEQSYREMLSAIAAVEKDHE